MSLAVCRPPAPLAVVWLETSRDIEQVDRSWLLAELAGAPLRVGQVRAWRHRACPAHVFLT